jgi:hypothetical protein
MGGVESGLRSIGREIARPFEDLKHMLVPEMPDVPKAPDAAQVSEETAERAAEAKDRTRRARARAAQTGGRASTLLTGGTGIDESAVATKTLMGS